MQKTTVVAPRTRIAIGILFCGTLIYSMVRPYTTAPTPSSTSPL